MDESMTGYASENFHFPRQLRLITSLRKISFIINDITLVVSLLTTILWLTNMFEVRSHFFNQQVLYPFTPILFILSCIPLLFGARRHLITTHHDATDENRPWWEFGAPAFFATITALLGFINFTGFTNNEILSLFHISPFAGICFFLIGISLIPPYTLIPHRFHITQFSLFVVSGLNVFVLLEYIFQLFSQNPTQHIVNVSLLAAGSFVLFCTGALLRWSNRGFLGNFTLDSTASIFALRVFVINLFSAPLIALLVLFLVHFTNYNMYIVLSVVVICFAFVSSLLLWTNVKILYGHELEHLLMRESLRKHDIDLTKEEEELQKRMNEIEQEKQQYIDKLRSQTAWQDATDSLG